LAGADGKGFWSVATHAKTLAVFRDPATREVELAGCQISAGEKVQIWKGSANRDTGIRQLVAELRP
jgi:cytochrome P450